ncbi:MAG: HDOD domain-containing protein [Pirellulales bacterium]|nr:HDOD domain-containing protein [Pirellulales bacterium]
MSYDPARAIDRLVDEMVSLYSLPSVVVEVLDLTNNPRIDIPALKNCIETDPALTSKILRVVNSSLFGLSKEVSDLNQALALLGVKPLKLLVLGFSLPDGLFAELAGEVLHAYWEHTLTKAVAAREIAETFIHAPPDEAFIAGLLQDLGSLVLMQSVGDPYIRFARVAAGERHSLLDLEQQTMGFNHTELTARLLDRWGLPAQFSEAVAVCAHADDALEDQLRTGKLAQVLHLAELLAELLAGHQEFAWPALLYFGQQYRGITEAQWDQLIGALRPKVEQLAEVLSLELPIGLSYDDILRSAHTRLIDAATDAAGELMKLAARGPGVADPATVEQMRVVSAAVAAIARRASEVEVAPPVRAAMPVASYAAVTSHVGGGGQYSGSSQSAGSVGLSDPPTLATNDDPALWGWLRAGVTAARQARQPLSLLLVEIDQYSELVFQHGLTGAKQLVDRVHKVCARIDHPLANSLQIREARFAIVLLDCDRREAARLGREVARTVQSLAPAGVGEDSPDVTVSVGAATVSLPPRNFQPQSLVDAADRCLYGARTSGGDSVKSIEI